MSETLWTLAGSVGSVSRSMRNRKCWRHQHRLNGHLDSLLQAQPFGPLRRVDQLDERRYLTLCDRAAVGAARQCGDDLFNASRPGNSGRRSVSSSGSPSRSGTEKAR